MGKSKCCVDPCQALNDATCVIQTFEQKTAHVERALFVRNSFQVASGVAPPFNTDSFPVTATVVPYTPESTLDLTVTFPSVGYTNTVPCSVLPVGELVNVSSPYVNVDSLVLASATLNVQGRQYPSGSFGIFPYISGVAGAYFLGYTFSNSLETTQDLLNLGLIQAGLGPLGPQRTVDSLTFTYHLQILA